MMISKAGLIVAIMSATVYIVIEINKLSGKQSPAVFWTGLVLTAIFFAVGSIMYVSGR